MRDKLFEYEVQDGKAILTSILDDNIEVLKIPSKVNGIPVGGFSKDLFRVGNNITKMTFPKSIEVSLYHFPFNNLEKLKELRMPVYDSYGLPFLPSLEILEISCERHESFFNKKCDDNRYARVAVKERCYESYWDDRLDMKRRRGYDVTVYRYYPKSLKYIIFLDDEIGTLIHGYPKTDEVNFEVVGRHYGNKKVRKLFKDRFY